MKSVTPINPAIYDLCMELDQDRYVPCHSVFQGGMGHWTPNYIGPQNFRAYSDFYIGVVTNNSYKLLNCLVFIFTLFQGEMGHSTVNYTGLQAFFK